jgi:formylglycine-generating enzyme required for sulfatase activity
MFAASASFCDAHDLAGNVWQWCADAYDAAKATDPQAGRVLRGGSWLISQLLCRSAIRLDYQPDGRIYYSGFRAARTCN